MITGDGMKGKKFCVNTCARREAMIQGFCLGLVALAIIMVFTGCFPEGKPPVTPVPTPVEEPTKPAATPVPAPPAGGCDVEAIQLTLTNGLEIRTPQGGKWVEESHYATTAMDGFPSSKDEGMKAHLEASCAVMQKRGLSCPNFKNSWQKQWTPANDGGINHWGQGARGPKKPTPEEEVWQGNLYFRAKDLPKHPTRYLVCSARKCVVVAFGHEIGPGSKKYIGGLTPEVFFSLEVDNESTLTLKGKLKDQTLPFGPISCGS